uniref:TF-B3 domain-containing protein n=1 Tax=Solanum lycopersicum TaxID=4081 RepID=A0A3Q7GGY0_SOLLC
MRLVNEYGVEWGVEIESSMNMVIIKGGWTAFREDNKKATRETCRFKLIRAYCKCFAEEEDILVLQDNVNVMNEEEEDILVNLQANTNVIEEEEEDITVNLQANDYVIEQETQKQQQGLELLTHIPMSLLRNRMMSPKICDHMIAERKFINLKSKILDE